MATWVLTSKLRRGVAVALERRVGHRKGLYGFEPILRSKLWAYRVHNPDNSCATMQTQKRMAHHGQVLGIQETPLCMQRLRRADRGAQRRVEGARTMNDEQETNHAFAHFRSNAGLDACPINLEHCHTICSAGTCKICRTERAKRFCNEIGCSGLSPDLCKSHPLDCGIVRKIGIQQ